MPVGRSGDSGPGPEGAAATSRGLSTLLAELARAPGEDLYRAWQKRLRPGDVVGRFEILQEIGRGGFGVVYEALDQQLGRSVAFKTLRPARSSHELAASWILKEAEAVARLDHPAIVTLHEIGTCDSGPYLVEELLRGETLEERLLRGPLSARDAVAVALEIAKALAHAHAHGVLHRDLKPGNVFLTEDGRVKLLDFGLAHLLGTRGLHGAGTLAYMAPEQLRGEPVDARADVFALGATLFEALVGEVPFAVKEGRNAVLDPGPPPAPPPGTAAPVRALLQRSLSRDPAQRPASGQAMVEELLAVERALGPAGAEGLVPPRAPARRRKLRLALLFAAMAAAVAGGLELVARHGRSSTELPRAVTVSRAPPSVAVLPFTDMSPGKDQEYFSDGMAEEILNALAHVDGLRVIGRTSSFSFKGRNEDLRTIGRTLGVGAILEGSVRKDANRVRVTAQLIDVSDGSHLWSEAYDRELVSVFDVQEQIARAVVGALAVKLLPNRAPSTRAVQTSSTEAYNLMLRARYVYSGMTRQSYLRAYALIEQAAALDPTYAAPHAMMAAVLRDMSFFADTPERAAELRRRAIAEAERSVLLGPELVDAYSIRSLLRTKWQHDWAGAEADVRRALELSPSDPASLRRMGILLAERGRLDEGIAYLARATQLEPLSAPTWHWLGILQNAAGERAEARVSLERSREVAPDSPEPRASLAVLDVLEGHPEAALARVPSLNEEDALKVTALADHDLHREEASLRALQRLISKHGHTSAQAVAEVYAWRGEADPAFEWLERARDQELDGLMYDPLLASLRSDPRFTALLRKLGLPAR